MRRLWVIAPNDETLTAWWASPQAAAFERQEQSLARCLLAQQAGAVGVQIGNSWGSEGAWDTLHRSMLRALIAEQPRAAAGLTLIRANLGALPLLAASVDLFWLPHTLESVPAPWPLMAELALALAPGGRMVISMLNPWGWLGLHYCWTQRRWLRRGLLSPYALRYHLARYELQTLQTYALYRDKAAAVPLRYPGEWLMAEGYLMVVAKRIPGMTPLQLDWRDSLTVNERLYEPSTRQH